MSWTATAASIPASQYTCSLQFQNSAVEAISARWSSIPSFLNIIFRDPNILIGVSCSTTTDSSGCAALRCENNPSLIRHSPSKRKCKNEFGAKSYCILKFMYRGISGPKVLGCH